MYLVVGATCAVRRSIVVGPSLCHIVLKTALVRSIGGSGVGIHLFRLVRTSTDDHCYERIGRDLTGHPLGTESAR